MSRRSKILFSGLFAIGFLILSYWVTNIRFPLSGEKELLSKLEFFRGFFRSHDAHAIDSVLFINVAYDIELRPVMGLYDSPDGYYAITDRLKLLKLLEYLKEKDCHRYILLDVFFTDRVHTEWDEELFNTIASMHRIVIPCHSDEALADTRLESKAGLADYLTTFSETDFVKYPYMVDSIKSLPVKMYEEVTGREIKRNGLFYTEDWHLVRKSIMLTYECQIDSMYGTDGQPIWYNLGTGLLGDSIPNLTVFRDSALYDDPQLIENRYIVIGSFKGDDSHSTFIGQMSGSVILFNAFISLMNGHHYVSITLALVLFVVFYFLCYLLLSRKTIKDIITNNSSFLPTWFLRFMNWLCSWIGLSVFLSMLCLGTYIALGEAYDIFLTSTIFYLLSITITFVQKLTDKHS